MIPAITSHFLWFLMFFPSFAIFSLKLSGSFSGFFPFVFFFSGSCVFRASLSDFFQGERYKTSDPYFGMDGGCPVYRLASGSDAYAADAGAHSAPQ